MKGISCLEISGNSEKLWGEDKHNVDSESINCSGGMFVNKLITVSKKHQHHLKQGGRNLCYLPLLVG